MPKPKRRKQSLRARVRRRHRLQAKIKFARKPIPPQDAALEAEAAAPKPVLPVKPHGAKQILLCPGPVNLSNHVRTALSNAEICHRESDFSDMLQTTRAKLIHALGLDGHYTSVILSGSGTAALESAVMAAVEPNKKLMVINNGVYGSRIAQLAKIHQVNLVEIRSPLTEPTDLSRISAALKRESGVTAVAMVHHETSTGMLNPVEEVGALTKKFHKRFLVDAISSLGAEKLDLNKANISLCVSSAGKALHGAPGLSLVLLSQEEASRIAKIKPKSLYLDLASNLKSQDAGDPPFTPAVPLYAAFHAAVDELAREGIKNRINRYRERAIFLRSGFKKLGLKFLLDEKVMSNSLTAMWLPQGKTYAQIHDPLRKAGYIIYAGQSELKGKILRIAHMGHLLQGDLKELLRIIKLILEMNGRPLS